MSGKIIASAIVGIALVFGALVYYLQVYYYYEPATLTADEVVLTRLDGEQEVLPARDIEAIDANSSPIRFRACFTGDQAPETLADRFQPYPAADPLNAPYWFRCFDATEIGEALVAGTARAFLGQKDIHHGVDRVIAVLDDGRGFIWHQVNEEIRQ